MEAIQRGNHDRAKVRQMKEDAIAEHAQETGMSEEDVSLYFVLCCCCLPLFCRCTKLLFTPHDSHINYVFFSLHLFPFFSIHGFILPIGCTSY